MKVTKLCGFDTEFAITGDEPIKASNRVVDAYLDLAPEEGRLACIQFGRSRDLMLANGARFYVDHAHPEYSTPECVDLITLLAAERAGAEIVRRCAEAASRDGSELRIYKNNSDHQNHSYGCHENYLMEAETYDSLFGNKAHLIYTLLAPFLVSRIVFAGSGKVGAENGREPVPFQLSQRADFFETVLGIQTTERRPIVNTRDEPHADRERFRRLHVIAGDANMCPYATWLKAGTTRLVLAAMEEDSPRLALALDDPVRAIVEISHDPSCAASVSLADGRSLTAIELQREFLEFARTASAIEPEDEVVLREWELTLEALEHDPQSLVGRLDWVTKQSVIGDLGAACGWGLESPQAIVADHLYHALDRSESLYFSLEEADLVTWPPGWDPALENRLIFEPPTASRAWLRGQIISAFESHIRGVDWSEIQFPKLALGMPDPLLGGQKDVGDLFEGSPSYQQFLDRLNDRFGRPQPDAQTTPIQGDSHG